MTALTMPARPPGAGREAAAAAVAADGLGHLAAAPDRAGRRGRGRRRPGRVPAANRPSDTPGLGRRGRMPSRKRGCLRASPAPTPASSNTTALLRPRRKHSGSASPSTDTRSGRATSPSAGSGPSSGSRAAGCAVSTAHRRDRLAGPPPGRLTAQRARRRSPDMSHPPAAPAVPNYAEFMDCWMGSGTGPVLVRPVLAGSCSMAAIRIRA